MAKRQTATRTALFYGYFDDIGIYLSRERKAAHTFMCHVLCDGTTFDRIGNVGITQIKREPTSKHADISKGVDTLRGFEKQTSFDPATFGTEGTHVDQQTKEDAMGINWKKHDTEKSQMTGKRNDFLKKSAIKESGTSAVIVDVREIDTEYSDYGVDLKIGAKEYTWGLKSGSVALDQLAELLGKNERKWKGKKVTLYLHKGKYINVR